MIELFTDISEFNKNITKLVVDTTLMNNTDVPHAIKGLEEYRSVCTPEVQEFVDFYVQLKLEEMKNEKSDIDQR